MSQERKGSKMKKNILFIILAVVIILILAGSLIFVLIDNSHYKRYKNIISQEEIEKTVFKQPISTSRNGEYRIGIKCAIDGDFHAKLTVYQAKDGKYEEVFGCPAVVGKNGPGKQSEGDTKTPLGTWTIGEAYGINDDPGSKIKYTKVTEDMYWCATGSNGKNYNKLIYISC